MDKTEPEQTIRKAGRPRSAQSHQAILEATLELFAEVGLRGLSIEAIAEQAGVGKTTIYRRWSSKEDIIKDAFAMMRKGTDWVDTGNIREDLLYTLKKTRELFSNNPLIGKLVIKLLAENKTHPDIYRAFYDKLAAPRIYEFRQLVERAQARGELRQDLDTTFLLQLIFSALIYGSLFTDIIDPYAQHMYGPEATVDALLHGIGTHEHT
jgi:AcrR family transcriptional regulator